MLRVFSNPNEGELKAIRLSNEVGDARVDVLETGSTSHQLEDMRRA